MIQTIQHFHMQGRGAVANYIKLQKHTNVKCRPFLRVVRMTSYPEWLKHSILKATFKRFSNKKCGDFANGLLWARMKYTETGVGATNKWVDRSSLLLRCTETELLHFEKITCTLRLKKVMRCCKCQDMITVCYDILLFYYMNFVWQCKTADYNFSSSTSDSWTHICYK